MEDVRDLKALQIDALREVANIGAGHGATALAVMTERRVMISVPRAAVVPLEEVPTILGDPDTVVAAALMRVAGDLTGRMLMVLTEVEARHLCDILRIAEQLGHILDARDVDLRHADHDAPVRHLRQRGRRVPRADVRHFAERVDLERL